MNLNLGTLGPKFVTLRPQQEDVLHRLLKSPHRIDVAALPTGTGKSLLGMAYAHLLEVPTVILTCTKGLQDQYQRDFTIHQDVRGMASYPCRIYDGRVMCDAGPCLDDEPCIWKQAGCAYYDRVKRAGMAPIVVTNYAFWFTHRFDHALGYRELVILDEAHELDSELAKAAGAEFSEREVGFEDGMGEWSFEDWREWAGEKLALTEAVLDRPSTTPFEKRKLRRLKGRLERLVATQAEWVWDYIGDREVRKVRFEPLDLSPYVESHLFRGASKGVLMSATVRPDQVSDLGITDFGFMESDSPFPVERRPIYWVQTGVRLRWDTSERNLRFWADKLDQVIDSRLGYKGIIHTVSYQRARFLEQHSRHSQHFILHDPRTAQATVQRFKEMKAPAILVSPVVHTGYDFPYDAARWQIIGKVPYPDTRSGIAGARQEIDDRWNKKFAARTLVQMAGRVVRSEDDMGETIILDDNVAHVVHRYKLLFPRWWREAFRPTKVVPKMGEGA